MLFSSYLPKSETVWFFVFPILSLTQVVFTSAQCKRLVVHIKLFEVFMEIAVPQSWQGTRPTGAVT